jgi:hypothetical protein
MAITRATIQLLYSGLTWCAAGGNGWFGGPRGKDAAVVGGSGAEGWIARKDSGYRRAVVRSDAFALSWYGARAAGELLRARSTSWLYQHPARGRSGGAHPDPRQPSPFSWWSILRAAVQDLRMELVEVTEPRRLAAVEKALGASPREVRWCWLTTYPDGGMPSIMHRPVNWRDSTIYRSLCWGMAMLLGDVCRNYGELTDPTYPSGYHVPSAARSHVACLHQFAAALLHTEAECPPEWGCDCARIRASLGIAPEEHLQATDALLLSDLRAEVLRQQAIEHQQGKVLATRADGGTWELPSSGAWQVARDPSDTPTG